MSEAIREELHQLVDGLSLEEVRHWLEAIRQAKLDEIRKRRLELLEQGNKLRAELEAKYGTLPSSVDILNEAREERLNDLMGGE